MTYIGLKIIPDPHSKWHNEVGSQRFMKQGLLVAQTQAALLSWGVHYIASQLKIELEKKKKRKEKNTHRSYSKMEGS